MIKNFPKYTIHLFNIELIIGSILFIILSYILMYVGSKRGIDILPLTIAPLMQLAGFIGIIYALIKN